jgi:hypothetical protein
VIADSFVARFQVYRIPGGQDFWHTTVGLRTSFLLSPNSSTSHIVTDLISMSLTDPMTYRSTFYLQTCISDIKTRFSHLGLGIFSIVITFSPFVDPSNCHWAWSYAHRNVSNQFFPCPFLNRGTYHLHACLRCVLRDS